MGFRVPEQYRVGPRECYVRSFPRRMATTESDGNNGLFLVPSPIRSKRLKVIASDGAGWEHVSVSAYQKKLRMPTWEECCAVKALFWDPEDVVVQFHPRESDYVNYHPTCLHLWRPIGVEIPTPPPILVGPVTGSGR